jgi:hypothetical protein
MLMDSAICGFAPTEKSEPPACRCSFLEGLEIDMLVFPHEFETIVQKITFDVTLISITQADPNGGDDDVIHLSSDRARKVAAELLRLADELEGDGN